MVFQTIEVFVEIESVLPTTGLGLDCPAIRHFGVLLSTLEKSCVILEVLHSSPPCQQMLTLPVWTKRVASQLVNKKTTGNNIAIKGTRNFTFHTSPYPRATPLCHCLRDEYTKCRPRPRSACTADPNRLSAHAQHSRRSLSGTTPLKMATDDEYMDFLNKANEDPGQGSASTQAQGGQARKELKAADHGANIPQPLVKATKDAFYMSDSDEPFVPVSLAWEKGEGLPDEGMILFHFSLLSTQAPSSAFH